MLNSPPPDKMMGTKQIQCPFCRHTASVKEISAKDIHIKQYDYYRCKHCLSLFMFPQPPAGNTEENYDLQYYGESESKFKTPGVERVLQFFRAQRAKKLLRYLPEKNKGSILDVGCGNGTFLHILGKQGDFQLFGSELPGKAATRSMQFPEIRLSVSGDFHEAVDRESLDAVTMFHVVEHLPDPAHYLESIAQALKKGGVFFVSFPNIDSWQARLFHKHWLHLDPPRHLVLFEPEAFISFFYKKGFVLLHQSSLSTEQNPFGMVQSLLNMYSGPRDLLYESMKGNTAYISDAGKMRLFLHRLFFLLSFPLFILTDFIAASLGKGATLTFIFRKTKENNEA